MAPLVRACLFLLLIGAAGAYTACSPSGDGRGSSDGSLINILDYQATLPATWDTREPSSNMRLAEFGTPGAEGSEGAEVVVFFFGPGLGGSVEAIIGRWQSQFMSPDGGHVAPKVTVEEGGAFPITVAEFTGSYARTMGMSMNPDSARADQGLVAAIVEVPEGNLFVQLFGPSASVAAERDVFLDFVTGLEPGSQGS